MIWEIAGGLARGLGLPPELSLGLPCGLGAGLPGFGFIVAPPNCIPELSSGSVSIDVLSFGDGLKSRVSWRGLW